MIPDETVSKLWNHPERIKESKSLFRKGILSYRTVFDLKSAISMKCKAYTNVIKINENTPIDIEESYKEIERIQLSNLQQNILDKLLKEPSSEEEIVREVNMEIKNDINYLISKNMISKKQYGEINIYHITGMGIETLRQLF